MGGGDHGMTGGSAHVHLFTMIRAPLGLISGSSIAVSMSIGGVSVTISIRGVSVTIAIRGVSVTIPSRLVAKAAAIASITISTIPA